MKLKLEDAENKRREKGGNERFLKGKSESQGAGKSRKHNCTSKQLKNDTCPRSNGLSHVKLNVLGTESQKAQMSRKWNLPYSFIH